MCQCPQRASTYFFKNGAAKGAKKVVCQCPQRASTYFFTYSYGWSRCPLCRVNALNGLLLISSSQPCSQCWQCWCVNALNGLLLISSIHTWDIRSAWHWCVNALNGLLLISSKSFRVTDDKNECVNALNGLLLISSPLKENSADGKKCVNALNGLLLISSASKAGKGIKSAVGCQCPQRASTYFFNVRLRIYWNRRIVSMPSTGFYLFLQYPPRTLDFTEFWRGFLQVINWIFCQLIFSIVFLCLCCGRNMYTHL